MNKRLEESAFSNRLTRRS